MNWGWCCVVLLTCLFPKAPCLFEHSIIWPDPSPLKHDFPSEFQPKPVLVDPFPDPAVS